MYFRKNLIFQKSHITSFLQYHNIICQNQPPITAGGLPPLPEEEDKQGVLLHHWHLQEPAPRLAPIQVATIINKPSPTRLGHTPVRR